MARRHEYAYERDLRDRRSRDPQEMSREQDSRDRTDSANQLRIDVPDPDSREYSRDGYSDLRSTRDSAPRRVYSYADPMDRGDVYPPSRRYTDDPRDRNREPIHLQSDFRREEPSSRYQEYFLPGEDINREVIQYDICRYLGNDATVRPYSHPDGRQGYLIKAYRAPTVAMITALKQDSRRFEAEQAQRRQQFGQPSMSFGSSATFDDRQRQGRPNVPQPGYAGHGMDTSMNDYLDDRGTVRGYRDQEPRMEPRMELWQDSQTPAVFQGYWQDPYSASYQRQPPMPAVSQGRPPGAYYPTSPSVETASSRLYDAAAGQPGIVEPYNTPPPPMARSAQAAYAGGYSIPTTETSGPERASADVVASRHVPRQTRGGHPGWEDTPNFRR